MVAHAYANVPYYRRLLDDTGVRPEEIRTEEDLTRLPITEKKDLRQLPVGDVVARGTEIARCLRPRSSGTSGVPLAVYRDVAGACIFYALTARALKMAGARIADTLMVIGPGYYPQGLLLQRLGVGRVTNLSPLQHPATLLDAIDAARPEILHAYASVLKSLLGYLRTAKRVPHRPRVIISSADYLDEGTRLECREVLGVAPVQMYGAVETGRVGCECSLRDGLHLFTDFVVPELLPLDGEGTPRVHRVVLTDLTNRVMPFIRYDQGDLAEVVEGPCECRSVFPRIRLLYARSSDVVRLLDGDTMSALRLGGPLWDVPGLDVFKIVQDPSLRLVVKAVMKEGSDNAALRAAVAGVAALVPALQVDLELVDAIPANPSGKFTHFQSMA
jgi:phenylacetate-CoA ligase